MGPEDSLSGDRPREPILSCLSQPTKEKCLEHSIAGSFFSPRISLFNLFNVNPLFQIRSTAATSTHETINSLNDSHKNEEQIPQLYDQKVTS